MRRYTEATPCPAPNLSFLNSNRYNPSTFPSTYAPSSYSQDDTTTTHLEYTTELQTNLRNAKPRRPRRDAARKSTFNSVDIFEDVALEEQQQAVEVKRRSRASILQEGGNRRSTILANPAQKLHISAQPVQELPPRMGRRRVSAIVEERQHTESNATEILRENILEQHEKKKSHLKKDPRRRTIFVPSDDTTVMTIHPGAPTNPPRTRNARERSPDLGLDLVTLSEEEPDNLVSVLKKDKKAPRKSLAVPPQRGPLQPTSRQGVTFAEDIMGSGGGKENVPPGVTLVEGQKKAKETHALLTKEHRTTTAVNQGKVHITVSKKKTTSTTKKPESSSQPKLRTVTGRKRISSELSYSSSPAKSHKTKADGRAAPTAAREAIKRAKAAHAANMTAQALQSSSPFHHDKSPPAALRRHRPEKPPSKLSVPHVEQKASCSKEKYPVLSEDLVRPELYEDHWLNYQEVAITQLVNSLFDSARKDPNSDIPPEELRKKLIGIYHEPAMPTLHKRLQASLLYGALSIPKDLLTQTLRLKDDVGMRRKFLNLWVNTYDLTSLRAALETVVGRQIPVSSRLSSGSTSSDDGGRSVRAEKRAIEGFLDTFLIRNEDAVRVKNGMGSIASIARAHDHKEDDFGSQGWSWRRTVLRSLMLILLLDKAKTADILPGCLFQIPSPHKASTEILQSLANMLFPSLGDISRPLGHLNYKVTHVQYPLQEYTYHVENLATDLRNGIILTRLIELLLYPPSTLATQHEETVTITMPSGEILTSAFEFDQKESWVLSQHLKFPSIGRAQKLYNVQIALSALDEVKGVPRNAVVDVKPENIVDGHREKTLGLLWALVGKFGLGTLVDWSEVEKEIARFREQWYDQQTDDSELQSDDDETTTELSGLDLHKHLLRSWSRNIARLHGLHVTNLTTSFADGKVLEAIVDAYLPPTLLPAPTTSRVKVPLSAKLTAAGCSQSFISLFTPTGTKFGTSIPSKDFTLITLSFLASRLLPLSRAHRAATTIQRAFRVHLARCTASKQIVLMRLAYECREVVEKREELVSAAVVVQRRWKGILEERRRVQQERVVGVQSLIRGWVVRRWCSRVTGGKVGGKVKERRVRGGW